jgi:hypothetical protein
MSDMHKNDTGITCRREIYIRLACLTLNDMPIITKRERKKVANWLRKQADKIESEGKNYAKQFVARYFI